MSKSIVLVVDSEDMLSVEAALSFLLHMDARAVSSKISIYETIYTQNPTNFLAMAKNRINSAAMSLAGDTTKYRRILNNFYCDTNKMYINGKTFNIGELNFADTADTIKSYFKNASDLAAIVLFDMSLYDNSAQFYEEYPYWTDSKLSKGYVLDLLDVPMIVAAPNVVYTATNTAARILTTATTLEKKYAYQIPSGTYGILDKIGFDSLVEKEIPNAGGAILLNLQAKNKFYSGSPTGYDINEPFAMRYAAENYFIRDPQAVTSKYCSSSKLCTISFLSANSFSPCTAWSKLIFWSTNDAVTALKDFSLQNYVATDLDDDFSIKSYTNNKVLSLALHKDSVAYESNGDYLNYLIYKINTPRLVSETILKHVLWLA